MTKPTSILLLAGTFEARKLARVLKQRFPDANLTASFAGVVSNLPDLGVVTRTGGFGGVEGLVDYLKAEAIDLIIDATHPFAAQISRNATEVASQTGVPLIRLERPEWKPQSGDRWTCMSSLANAAEALPEKARTFLSIGRKEIRAFTHRTDIFALARMIEPPSSPLPSHWHLELSRPAQTVNEEVTLLKRHQITHIVCKNSGGTRSYAKIEAARLLGLPVIIIERPKLPAAISGKTVEDVLDLVGGVLT